ncbi:hypothetical protein M3A49_11155 [Paraburkholderia sp. CNPSo 3076]|uniref:hypothetical protein n=1 Tax=Paraburkholderia sp. CNPSo 3076 TaxID=2940936 RepID=UPI0022595F7F|nr:hypothetical protein [Paraburkholderia sp. CNPSo 3076]MCX5540043.1 hypothetical protein [Paraburkholderia sp. CNPSo 3076]
MAFKKDLSASPCNTVLGRAMFARVCAVHRAPGWTSFVPEPSAIGEEYRPARGHVGDRMHEAKAASTTHDKHRTVESRDSEVLWEMTVLGKGGNYAGQWLRASALYPPLSYRLLRLAENESLSLEQAEHSRARTLFATRGPGR